MAYYGSWKIDDVLTFVSDIHAPADGSEIDADSVPTYRVYENVTTAPIVTGSMALLDDGNTVGFYAAQITLSAASGFERGKSYHIRIHGISTVAANTSQITRHRRR